METKNAQWYKYFFIYNLFKQIGFTLSFYYLFWIIMGFIYVFYVLPNSKCDDSGFYGEILFLIGIFSVAILPITLKKNSKYVILGPLMYFTIIIIPYMKYDNKMIHKGPSIIRKCRVTHIGSSKMFYAEVNYKFGDKIKKAKISPCNPKDKEWIYGIHNPGCKTSMELYNDNPSQKEIDFLRDIAFEEDSVIYTLYDYSIKNPQFVYYNYGINVVYKAVKDSISPNSIVKLRFVDIIGINRYVNYDVKRYNKEIPDTFLIYQNLNEELSIKYTVCAPEVNTLENRNKISDYGYIFNYSIFNKYVIENQSSIIKGYTDDYKIRNKTALEQD